MNWDVLSSSPHAVVRAAGVAIRWSWPGVAIVLFQAVFVAAFPLVGYAAWIRLAFFLAIDLFWAKETRRQYRVSRDLEDNRQLRLFLARLEESLERER